VVSVELIGAGEELPPALALEWDGLARASSAPPFVRPGWIGAWRRSFGSGTLEVLTLRRDGRLRGVLPMERRRGGLASPTNAHTPSFGAVAESAPAAQALMRAALERSRASVRLEQMTDDFTGLAALSAAAREARTRTSTRILARSPYVDTRGERSAYEAGLDAKLLREVRRRRRRLESQGPVELDVSDGATGLDELLDEGLRIEGAAWKAAHGTAIASDEGTLSFYRSVGRWAADAGILRLAFLRVGGRPLAFDLCLEQDGSHYLLKTGFDPGARALAPGIMIRWEMIARAFTEGLASYEFLGKDDAWKLRWTSATRVLLAARAFAPSIPGAASRLWWTGGRPLARRVLRRV
jgi:CelD/BcsL family acetyltransferase involved in cellulose biosynthesis